jgi:uncharacterized protein (TIGR02391 family)
MNFLNLVIMTTIDIDKVLDEIDNFVLDLDSEYYSDIVQMVLGKIDAMRSYFEVYGFLDLVSKIDESEPDEDNIISVLELLRGYIIPDARRRLSKEHTNSDIESFWSHLHPKVRKIAKSRYDAGHYADSVQAILKELNNNIKTHSKELIEKELDGSNLMNHVFSYKNPIISLADLSTETGQNIQKGYMQIFSGTMTGIRNPTAHENLQIDKIRTIHYLYLVSLLFSVFDERQEPQ